MCGASALRDTPGSECDVAATPSAQLLSGGSLLSMPSQTCSLPTPGFSFGLPSVGLGSGYAATKRTGLGAEMSAAAGSMSGGAGADALLSPPCTLPLKFRGRRKHAPITPLSMPLPTPERGGCAPTPLGAHAAHPGLFTTGVQALAHARGHEEEVDDFDDYGHNSEEEDAEMLLQSLADAAAAAANGRGGASPRGAHQAAAHHADLLLAAAARAADAPASSSPAAGVEQAAPDARAGPPRVLYQQQKHQTEAATPGARALGPPRLRRPTTPLRARCASPDLPTINLGLGSAGLTLIASPGAASPRGQAAAATPLPAGTPLAHRRASPSREPGATPLSGRALASPGSAGRPAMTPVLATRTSSRQRTSSPSPAGPQARSQSRNAADAAAASLPRIPHIMTAAALPLPAACVRIPHVAPCAPTPAALGRPPLAPAPLPPKVQYKLAAGREVQEQAPDRRALGV